MLTHYRNVSGIVRWMGISIAILTLVLALNSDVKAQLYNNQRAVGGISCDANGLIGSAQPDDQGNLAKYLKQSLQAIPADLKNPIPLERISLRRLEVAIEKHGDKLPDEIKYLGGLQQIRYIFVYPEQKDIVLVGPAEGWKVDNKGYIVGITTGRPVLLLDDLLVALRTARQAADGGISCSIDPTPEGLTRLRAATSRMRTVGNPQQRAAQIVNALGKQKITLAGVPTTSHFARVLVAADYRMKRLGMGLEKSPIDGLPSYPAMMKGGNQGMLPRWWLEPNYKPILHSADGLAWELRDAGVKVMTEEDRLSAGGKVQRGGKASPLAQKWADNMTAKFSELAVAEPIFGQMRNCMELAIVSALIVKEQLPHKAGYSMPTLLNPADVKTETFNAPKQIDSQVNVLKKGRTWVFATGGVLINSWVIADRAKESDAPASIRAKAVPGTNGNWRWN